MIKSCYPYLERAGHKVQDIIQSVVILFECAHLGVYRHVLQEAQEVTSR